ncbi:MAG: isocitrate lyase/PEP mutase family protein [Mycobacterium sp.]|nr:isocitrate lyase/PEP mutase family protein [Mycobacterium sp.]
MPYQQATGHLRELLRRTDRVLSVMHTPSAGLARVMQEAGAEVGFVGTAGVVGAYTGMEDVGVASIPECVTIGGWIARAVEFPVILDGDTGHGGIMAVRRLVEDSIRAGLAGVRIDDQDIEAKRGTTSAGISVAPLDVVLSRYRAAVDCAREFDPDFVVMAQCYVGEAKNGSFEEALHRMRLYREVAHVDWVQFTAPRSIDDIRHARAVVDGPFSVMESHLPAPLDHPELLELGISLQWAPGVTHLAAQTAVYEMVSGYMRRGPVAVREFRERYADNPYITRRLPKPGRAVEQQRDLEARYFGSS